IDPSAPMRWAGAAIDAADPALPDGVEALSDYVKAPKELARRLAQIGVIKCEEAARLTPMLKPGQRLVSREGDLWRWGGVWVGGRGAGGGGARLGRQESPRGDGGGGKGGAARGRGKTESRDGRRGGGRLRRPSRGRRARTLAYAAARSAGRARAARRGRARDEPQRGAPVGAARGGGALDREPRGGERGAQRGAARAQSATGRRQYRDGACRRARRDRRPARAPCRGARGSTGARA